MTQQPLSLMIVDGHDRARSALTERLHRLAQAVVVASVGEIEHARAVIGHHAPDAVLLEPRTMDVPPLEALHRLVGSGPPILVWTTSLDADEAETFMRAGAAAALLKNTDAPGLLSRIHAAIAAHGHRAHDGP